MHKITNRTASPYDLQTVDGSVRIPAFGVVEGEFSPGYLEILRGGGAVEIEEVSTAPASSPDFPTKYQVLAGRSPDKRWSEKRLKAEIDKLEAANADHVS